jgi:hypothetical protein
MELLDLHHNIMAYGKIMPKDMGIVSQIKVNYELDETKPYIDDIYFILKSNWSHRTLVEFDRYGLLDFVFADVTALKDIQQNKFKTLDAFHHTMKVLNEADKMFGEDVVMKLAALFHDTGKVMPCDNTFHEVISVEITENFLKCVPIISTPETITRLLTIIRYHMIPLTFQRNPNWNDESIIRFDNKVRPYTKDVIDFSKCDKLASHKNPEYLKPLDRLWERILELRKD